MRPDQGPSRATDEVANRGLVRPPLVYLASILTGSAAELAWPLPFVSSRLAAPLGALLVVAEYHGSLNVSGAHLLSDAGGNQVFCKCVDANADGVCDPPATCIQNPNGTSQATINPSLSIM